MDPKPRFALPAIATILFAVACLVYGSLRPELNYDVVAYAALAKEMRGAGGKAEAYRELALKVGDNGFQSYVSGPYRERMYRDDDYFQLNHPLYTIRPLYISLCSAVGWLLHSDIAATYVVSAVATAAAVLLSYVLAGAIGLAGAWRLAVPLVWIATEGLHLASLSTPDGLETLLSLLFVLISMRDPWNGTRAIGLAVIAALMVATRTDAVLLVAFLMLTEVVFEPRHRATSALVFLVALATYLVVQKVSGNYGYIAVLNFQLIEDRSHGVFPNLVPNLPGYLAALIHGVTQILGRDTQSALFSVAISFLAFTALRVRPARARATDAAAHRAFILAVGLLGYLLARFVLFPAPWARYMMSAYVPAGILFARAIQAPLAASQIVRRPQWMIG